MPSSKIIAAMTHRARCRLTGAGVGFDTVIVSRIGAGSSRTGGASSASGCHASTASAGAVGVGAASSSPGKSSGKSAGGCGSIGFGIDLGFTGFATTGGGGASCGFDGSTGFASTGGAAAGGSVSSRTSNTARQIGFGQRIRLPRMASSSLYLLSQRGHVTDRGMTHLSPWRSLFKPRRFCYILLCPHPNGAAS